MAKCVPTIPTTAGVARIHELYMMFSKLLQATTPPNLVDERQRDFLVQCAKRDTDDGFVLSTDLGNLGVLHLQQNTTHDQKYEGYPTVDRESVEMRDGMAYIKGDILLLTCDTCDTDMDLENGLRQLVSQLRRELITQLHKWSVDIQKTQSTIPNEATCRKLFLQATEVAFDEWEKTKADAKKKYADDDEKRCTVLEEAKKHHADAYFSAHGLMTMADLGDDTLTVIRESDVTRREPDDKEWLDIFDGKWDCAGRTKRRRTE